MSEQRAHSDGGAVRSAGAGRGVLGVLAVAVLWSSSGVFIKTIHTPWVTIAFYRALSAGLVLLPLAVVQFRRSGWGRPPDTPRRVWFAWMAAMTGCYACVISLFVWATKLTTAANAIVLEYTAPLYAFLFSAVLLGTRIGRRQWQALAVAMLGVGVLLVGAFSTPSGAAPGGGRYHHVSGCLLAVGVAVLFGMIMVALRRLRGIPTAVSTSLNNLSAAVLLVPVLLLWPTGRGGLGAAASVSVEQALALVAMGLFNIAVPYVLFTWSLRHVEATVASLLLLLNPVLNPLLVLPTGEVPGPWTIGGGAVILAALAMLTIRVRPLAGQGNVQAERGPS